jgi:hypothetical protein
MLFSGWTVGVAGCRFDVCMVGFEYHARIGFARLCVAVSGSAATERRNGIGDIVM